MESEDSKLANGAANREKAEDLVSESDSISGEEELETPKGLQGTDDTIKDLHHEIQSLRRDRTELRRRIDDIRSEAESKSLAFHASYLEGELVRTQEDLAAASASASDAESELSLLKSSVKSLEESAAVKEFKIADLELERASKDGEIQALTEEVRVSKEELERTVKELQATIAREEVLEKSVKEMQKSNSELERKIKTLLAANKNIGLELEKTFKRSSELEGKIGEQKSRELELETAMTATGSSVSWVTTAGVAASTGAIAVVLTVLYLRRQR
ncbi:myosin heavy chain, striated muscle-like [Iris pallida]|uniref:Myosin heavy chain, striated muscle-like n=1 Tax=Iris pallida TaxID=29817 RepID=A0AAX6DRQ4_IRIPA|nr:myosin heavy chain, striated muscle-like [Iris pallida]